MRAVLVVDVPDAFVRQCTEGQRGEGSQPTAPMFFADAIHRAADELTGGEARAGWPAGVSIVFPCGTCHGDGKKCPTCGGSGQRPGTELTPA